jgi:CXXX repeat modification system protein
VKVHVGEVTEEERDQILRLHEHRNGLEELTMCLDESDVLVQRVARDREETAARYSMWWSDTARRYRWESKPDLQWELEFSTRKVFLVRDTRSR